MEIEMHAVKRSPHFCYEGKKTPLNHTKDLDINFFFLYRQILQHQPMSMYKWNYNFFFFHFHFYSPLKPVHTTK